MVLAHQLRALLARLQQRLPGALHALQRRPRADREPADWPDRAGAAFRSWLVRGGGRGLARWLPALRATFHGLTDCPGGRGLNPSPDPPKDRDALLPDGPATSAMVTASLAAVRFAVHAPAHAALAAGAGVADAGAGTGVSGSTGAAAADPGSARAADGPAPDSAPDQAACLEAAAGCSGWPYGTGAHSTLSEGLRPAASCLAWLRAAAPAALPAAAPAAALRAACFSPPAVGARRDSGPAAPAAAQGEPGAAQDGAEAPGLASIFACAEGVPPARSIAGAGPTEPSALHAACEPGAELDGGHGTARAPEPGASLLAEAAAAAVPAGDSWVVMFPEFVEALARCLACPHKLTRPC